MEDPELQELRKRRLADIQRQQQDQVAHQAAAEEQAKRIEDQRQAILRSILTPQARERLGTVKIAHPEVARLVEDQLISLASSGRLDHEIDDDTLRAILRKLAPQKREITIERK
jgi:programmed cell death protein 5